MKNKQKAIEIWMGINNLFDAFLKAVLIVSFGLIVLKALERFDLHIDYALILLVMVGAYILAFLSDGLHIYLLFRQEALEEDKPKHETNSKKQGKRDYRD